MNTLRGAVRDLGAVPLDALRAMGVEGLILDLDNTLVPAGRDEIPETTRGFLSRARAMGLKMIIVSNGAPERSLRLAEALGLPCLARARKPARRAYRRALECIGLAPERVAAIGDQFLTDGLGAWRAGVHLVLVEPLAAKERLFVRAGRPVDRLLRRELLTRDLGAPGARETT